MKVRNAENPYNTCSLVMDGPTGSHLRQNHVLCSIRRQCSPLGTKACFPGEMIGEGQLKALGFEHEKNMEWDGSVIFRDECRVGLCRFVEFIINHSDQNINGKILT
ncbi:hypothetical protein JTB14_011778 [Gonioctena quinquepunctata]|nr:hypothetical protein JTB14_011778 [Gonioctena quinquepunctata]